GVVAMTSIDIDFDVFKELTIRRKNEAMTENAVLRDLLGLPSIIDGKSHTLVNPVDGGGTPWVSIGITLPQGTEVRATYRGQQFTAIVENGALVLNGKRYKSPSAAAISITGNPVNGWRFWECLMPGSSRWKLIATYRH